MSKSNDVNEKYPNESGVNNVDRKTVKVKDKKEEERTEEAIEEENFVVVPPNGGWGWVIVFSAFYCNVVVDGIQLTFGIFLKAISKEFETEFSKVALAGSLMFGIHLLMGPVTSGCNAVFGLRPVTITGSLICCFGVGISYFSTRFWHLYISFGIIGGIGLGLVYMNTLVITSLYFTSLLPVAIAIVVCGTGIGTMSFAGLGLFLLKVTTWQNSFLIQAAFAGSMTIAALTFKPLKPVKVKIADSGLRQPVNEEEVGGTSSSIRTSIFIKTEIPARGSIVSVRTYQNLAWSFAENVDLREKEKKSCVSSTCCRKKMELPEDEEILVLKEIRNDPQTHRKSYMEKHETEDEEEIIRPERLNTESSVSYKTIYTRIDKNKEKSGKKFWKTIKHTFVVMLNCSLLTSCSFFIFTLSGAVSLAAFLIVFIYEKDRCEEDFGFSESKSAYFIIALGGVNVFWRLVLGGIAVMPKIHYGALAISGMTIGGVATMASGFNSNIYFQFAFCFVFGLAMASFAVFRIPLLINMVGVEFIENATGINLLFMGVFCIVFPPVFGWIKEASHSYNVIFLINGSLIVLSSLMLIRLKRVDMSKIKNNRISTS